MGSIRRTTRFAVAGLAAASALSFAAPAWAGKSGSPRPSSGGSGSSLSLVLVDSTDGLAHWGQTVTYKVATTATTQPWVSTTCQQNGTTVLSAMAGFFPGYLWPAEQNVTLTTPSWSGGAADCVASLIASNSTGSKQTTLATLSFHVSA